MPTPTYTPLANITLGSSAASVTFSSISQAYRDLVLIASGRSTRADTLDIYKILLNSATSGYVDVVAYGTGSSTGSYVQDPVNEIRPYALTGANATSGLYGFLKLQVMDYSATDKHKTMLLNEDAPGSQVTMSAYRWGSTSAVTSITIGPLLGANLAAGSTFALYGIAS